MSSGDPSALAPRGPGLERTLAPAAVGPRSPAGAAGWRRRAAGLLAGLSAGPAPLILGLFLGSRIALLAVGLLTQIFILPYAAIRTGYALSHHGALSMWGPWDAGWYQSIALGGYHTHAQAAGQANWGFFPAFPVISAAVARLLHVSVFPAMLLTANAAFLGGLFLVHRLTREEFDRPSADLAAALLCVAPGSYVFSSAYTESLFVLALAGSLLAMRRRRWLLAGALAALATLTRNLGIGLEIPLALGGLGLAARLWRAGVAERRPLALELGRLGLAGLLPLLALAGFCALLWRVSGDPLAFVHIQQTGWGHVFVNPLDHFANGLLQPAAVPDREIVSLLFAWLALAGLLALAVLRRWSLLGLAAFLVLAPLSAGLLSFQRYFLAVLPVFMAAAALLSGRPAARQATLAACAILNGFLMAAWTLGLEVVT